MNQSEKKELVEKSMHSVIRSAIQSVYELWGIRVHSIDIDWIEASNIDSEKHIIKEIRTVSVGRGTT